MKISNSDLNFFQILAQVLENFNKFELLEFKSRQSHKYNI